MTQLIFLKLELTIPRKVIALGICKKTLFIKGQRGREEDRTQPGYVNVKGDKFLEVMSTFTWIH